MCAVLSVGFAAASGCEDEVEDIDESIDCAEICEKYQDCFDDDYDVDNCQERCEDRADAQSSRDQEQSCSECIDDMSCGGATFSCAADCVGIVP
jgi:hypothetical protein